MFIATPRCHKFRIFRKGGGQPFQNMKNPTLQVYYFHFHLKKQGNRFFLNKNDDYYVWSYLNIT